MRLSLMTLSLIPFSLIACSEPAPASNLEIETPPIAAEPVESPAVSPPTEPEQPAGYSEPWNKIPFWSGEYPNAFGVVAPDVRVLANTEINKDAQGSLDCPLPQKAVYSPWNAARVETDALDFITMVYPTKITLNEAIELETYVSETPTTLSLKAGDVMTYETYLAEGWFIASFEGGSYELQENELPQSTVFEQGPEDDEWLRLTCADADQTQAWVKYSDIIKTPGIEAYHYMGYGEAADLP